MSYDLLVLAGKVSLIRRHSFMIGVWHTRQRAVLDRDGSTEYKGMLSCTELYVLCRRRSTDSYAAAGD